MSTSSSEVVAIGSLARARARPSAISAEGP